MGTAAAVGAQTGYQLSWVALLVAPLLGVVLAIARWTVAVMVGGFGLLAVIGAVAGRF